VNTDTLMAAMPGLPRDKAQAYLAPMETAMREFGITSQPRACMWLAQTGHESLSLRHFEEIASGAAYEGRKDLGNTQPGDGKRFKGRGPIQITGRFNYTEAGKALGLPLVTQPQLAAQPQHAFRVSAWWWRKHGLNEISDRQDVTAATRRINGGTRGLADRQSRYARCRALGAAVVPGPAAPAPPPGTVPPLNAGDFSRTRNANHPDVRIWQQRMRQRGWNITVDGIFGPQSETIARQFQREKGLADDGIVGPETWSAAWTAPVT